MSAVRQAGPFYVSPRTRGGAVLAYTVRDCVHGLTCEHASFEVAEYGPDKAKAMAEFDRDNRNLRAGV